MLFWVKMDGAQGWQLDYVRLASEDLQPGVHCAMRKMVKTLTCYLFQHYFERKCCLLNFYSKYINYVRPLNKVKSPVRNYCYVNINPAENCRDLYGELNRGFDLATPMCNIFMKFQKNKILDEVSRRNWSAHPWHFPTFLDLKFGCFSEFLNHFYVYCQRPWERMVENTYSLEGKGIQGCYYSCRKSFCSLQPLRDKCLL